MAIVPTTAQHALLLLSFWKVKFLEFALMRDFLLDPIHRAWEDGREKEQFPFDGLEIYLRLYSLDHVRHPLKGLYLYFKGICVSG